MRADPKPLLLRTSRGAVASLLLPHLVGNVNEFQAACGVADGESHTLAVPPSPRRLAAAARSLRRGGRRRRRRRRPCAPSRRCSRLSRRRSTRRRRRRSCSSRRSARRCRRAVAGATRAAASPRRGPPASPRRRWRSSRWPERLPPAVPRSASRFPRSRRSQQRWRSRSRLCTPSLRSCAGCDVCFSFSVSGAGLGRAVVVPSASSPPGWSGRRGSCWYARASGVGGGGFTTAARPPRLPRNSRCL